jgi:thiol-disulfide isomerase/thioredoxin
MTSRSAAWILAVAAAAWGCRDGASGPAARSDGAGPAARTAAIEIADLARVDAVLARHRGRAVLLNFWAIWCEPCVEELPELGAVARRFRGDGGSVIGVSYDLMIPAARREDVLPRMERFLAARELDFDVLVFDGEDFDAINARFDLPGEIPVTLAIDREGRVVDRHEGKASAARFEAMMQKALGRG